eukprot:4710410-Pyramimonas_sp.AAC.1
MVLTWRGGTRQTPAVGQRREGQDLAAGGPCSARWSASQTSGSAMVAGLACTFSVCRYAPWRSSCRATWLAQ